MGSEVFIYAYGLVCLSMMAFNLIYSVYLHGDSRRTGRRAGRAYAVVSSALDGLDVSGALPHGHMRRMEDILSNVTNLLTLSDCLDAMPRERSARYLTALAPVFVRLADRYEKREETQGAYFCHFIAVHGALFGDARAELAAKMAQYVGHSDLYSRVNALKALCALGDAGMLLDSLLLLGQDVGDGAGIHEKVIVEALMNYGGDRENFISLIWRRFERFPEGAQRVLLDYIRFSSGESRDEMLKIMLDTSRDKELRFSAIRYFGRYPDERAREPLIGFVSDTDPGHWEYAAISASSLARYPGEDTVAALSDAMHSPSWYVRYNSADSLEKLGFTYEDLLGRAAGSDRYAREMLTYRLELRYLNEAREKAAAKEAAVV